MEQRASPLAAVHRADGARFVEFGGWDMPVEFDTILAEHRTVRESVGKFDVSHMGQIEVTGPDAVGLTNRLTTNDVADLDPGESQYAMITDEDGVILDDTVVYRRGDEEVLFVPNAGHDAEMAARWIDHRDRWGLEAAVRNATEDAGMIAVQGPESAALVVGLTGDRGIRDLSRFEAAEAAVAGVDCYVARTGYTGEDGFELIVPWDDAEAVWTALDCPACGLGARDTLRIEMGYLLSGHEFDPEDNPRTPYEAGVGFTVKLDTDFVGRDALERVDVEGVDEKLVGFVLVDRGVPRHGYPITDPDGAALGAVTSGTVSPTLNESIGLGYVPVDHAEPGTPLRVVVRDDPKKAKTRPLPFLPDR